MITSLTDPKLAVEVLNALRMLCELPKIGIVAGQAVASLIDRFTGKGFAPVNDVDLFLMVPQVIESKLDIDRCELGTKIYQYVSLDEYLNLGSLGVDVNDTYQISTVKRDGILNTIYYSAAWATLTEPNNVEKKPKLKDMREQTCDRVGRIINAFDINCTQVGLDLRTGQLVYTKAYAFFWKTRQLEVASAHTPFQTAVRLIEKLNNIENAYLNQEQQLNGLSCIVHNLNGLKDYLDFKIRYAKKQLPATKYMGAEYAIRFEAAKSKSRILNDLFDVQLVQSTKADRPYYVGLSSDRNNSNASQRHFEYMSREFDEAPKGYEAYAILLKTRFLASGYMPILKASELELPKKSRIFVSETLKPLGLPRDQGLIAQLQDLDKPITLASVIERWSEDILDANSIVELHANARVNQNWLAKLVEHGPDCFSRSFDEKQFKKALEFFEKKHNLIKLNVGKKHPIEAIDFYRKFLVASNEHPYLIGMLESSHISCVDANLDELVKIASNAYQRALKRIERFKDRPKPQTKGATELLDPIDLAKEGREMSHCVTGYFISVANGNTRIISIKANGAKRADNDRATLELDHTKFSRLLLTIFRKNKTRSDMALDQIKEKLKDLANAEAWMPNQIKGFANATASWNCLKIAVQCCQEINGPLIKDVQALLGANHFMSQAMKDLLCEGVECGDFKTSRAAAFRQKREIAHPQPQVPVTLIENSMDQSGDEMLSQLKAASTPKIEVEFSDLEIPF